MDDSARLPKGAEVKVEVVESGDNGRSRAGGEALRDLLMRHAGKGRGLPTDLAAHHDHYAHGKPRP
jgi:hypothetical protein